MTLTKIITSIAVAGGIGVVSTPLIYQSQIDKFIAQEKQELKTLNIQVDEKSKNDTFTTTKREYILTIKDITPIVTQLYPNMRSLDLKDLKRAFDNTKFLVKINFFKYPVYHKNAVEVSLYSLNDNSTKELQTDEYGKQILNYIKNQAFLLSADIDNFEIAKAKLKDLNINLSDKTYYQTENLKLTTKNIFLTNDDKITFNIDDVKFNYSKIDNDTKHKYNDTFELKNLTYNIKIQNGLNYKTSTNIKNITYKTLSPYKYDNLTFSINNISSSSNVNSVLKSLTISNKFSVNNFKISANNGYIKANNLVFNNTISKLDAIALQNLIKVIQNQNQQEIEAYELKLINNGVKIKINPLSIQNVDINVDKKQFLIDPAKLTFDATLDKNNYSFLSFDLQNLLKDKITAKLHFETTQKNINLASKINPNIPLILASVMQTKNNKAIIDIEYKNGHIYSKGIKLF